MPVTRSKKRNEPQVREKLRTDKKESFQRVRDTREKSVVKD